MEAAQYLMTLLTYWHQNFTKWALFRNTEKVFQNFANGASMEVRWPQSTETWQVCLESAYLVKFWFQLVNRVQRY